MDRSLVERARGGDRIAFGELATRLADDLFAVAARILRDSEAAGDAVQVTLVQIWRDLPALRELDRFEAWAHRIVINRCYAQIRADRRRPRFVDVLPNDASVADMQGSVGQRDELERAFRRLTGDQRAVLVLVYVRDLPIADVAGILGVSPGTVKSRLFGARAAMRAAIDADSRPATQGIRA